MCDPARLLRDYRQAQKQAARARDVLDTVGRGAAVRNAFLGEFVGPNAPAPMAGLSRHARETLAAAESAASLRLAMLAQLVGRDRAASMAGVSHQTVNDAYRAVGASPPPDDVVPVPAPPRGLNRWLSRRRT